MNKAHLSARSAEGFAQEAVAKSSLSANILLRKSCFVYPAPASFEIELYNFLARSPRPRAGRAAWPGSLMVAAIAKQSGKTETFSQRTTGFSARLSVTNGKSYASQASIPPSSGRTLVTPLARSSSATRALVASLGHEQ
jgi:hypothetical protein